MNIQEIYSSAEYLR